MAKTYDYIQYQEESDGRERLYLSCNHFMSETEDASGKTLAQTYSIGENSEELGFEKAAATTMLELLKDDHYYASARDIALARSIVDGTRVSK